jgi:hypothetical protein
MKKIWFMLGGVALMLLVAAVFALDKKQLKLADARAKIEELGKQVDSLQARIKEMEQRLAILEKRKDKAIVSAAPVTGGSAIVQPRVIQDRELLEGSFADPSHPPKIWGEGECNGWKYYMVPLVTTERGVAMPIPLAGEPLPAR